MKLNVLHIVNWYPTKKNPGQGIFIKEQIKSIDNLVNQNIIHIDAVYDTCIFKIKRKKISETESSWLASSKIFKYYSITEWMVYFMLLYLFRVKKVQKGYDLINFHVAFPLLNKFKSIAHKLVQCIVVTEHYSGYHFNFGLTDKPRKLWRFKKLFTWQKNFITVSDALAKDINMFSEAQDLQIEVVPNVVNEVFFKHHTITERLYPDVLNMCMITNWSMVKNPFPVFEAIQKLISTGLECKLTIGGDGPQLAQMKSFVHSNNLTNHIHFRGRLNKLEVSDVMAESDVLLHNSHYETFSVICAESFCLGIPVIASAVGGINELIDSSNGILVTDHTNADAWFEAIQKFKTNRLGYNGNEIKLAAQEKYSEPYVGNRYHMALCKFALAK